LLLQLSVPIHYITLCKYFGVGEIMYFPALDTNYYVFQKEYKNGKVAADDMIGETVHNNLQLLSLE
jgi:hypothetical protein